MGAYGESLGAEVARVYREKQVQAEEEERTERLNSEAIVLARKLSLSPEQEVQVREALAQMPAFNSTEERTGACGDARSDERESHGRRRSQRPA